MPWVRTSYTTGSRNFCGRAELLLPEPYDSYYAHYLAAQMDAALGETDRYANEMQLANENQQEFAAWCRHTYLPRMATKWRY